MLLFQRPPVASLVLMLVLGGLIGCDGAGDPPKNIQSEQDAFSNSLGMRFHRIPAGTFQMGSANGQDDEIPVHEVTISEDFYMGVFEVTQAQWETLMGDNPSHFDDPWRPVERVSWHDVQAFIQKLNEREDVQLYRLPTEAEWEYAVRAGSRTEYHFGNERTELPDHAWYSVNSEEQTFPVGRKQSNAFGLHDMYGNVWEWLKDTYDPTYYDQSPEVDPLSFNITNPTRVIRGGGWSSVASDMRSANRSWARPSIRIRFVGFRLVREIPDE